MTNPALEQILAAKRAAPYEPDQTVEELRAASEAAGQQAPLPDGTVYTAVSADGIPCEWIEMPGARQDHVFLFIHGGGYYRGSVAASRATAAAISAAARARCLAVGYRLAPEHPFPAAIDDCLTVYRWLLAEGTAAGRIVVGGISAGGGLTLALLLGARDEGLALPAAAVPMSAWTDLTQSGASYQANAALDPVISKQYLDRMAGLYLAGADALTPLASPLHGDLHGLPPLLLQVGTAETMLDDSAAFAEKAQAAGVDVCFEPWAYMFHGWHGFADVLPEARQAIDRVGAFFKEHAG